MGLEIVDGLTRSFWPLLFSVLAAFLFLAILSAAYFRSRALADLWRLAARLRERQERIRDRVGTSALLPRYRRFEHGIRALLAREGIQVPPRSHRS